MTYDDEDLIRSALLRERPDPRSFEHSTLAKLDAGEAQRAEIGEEPAHLVQAACAAPVHLFPALLSARSFGWMALPVVLVAAAGMTFLWSLQALMGSRPTVTEQVAGGHSSEILIKAWWRRNAAPACLTLLAVASLAWFLPLEAILLLFIVSMTYVASIVRNVTAGGSGSRSVVGTMTAEFLGLLVLVLLFMGDLGQGIRSAHFHEAWIPATLLAGAFACDLLGSWRSRTTPVRKVLGWLPMVTLIGLMTLVVAPRGRMIDQNRLVAYAESFDAPIDDVVEWQRFGAIRAALDDLAVAVEPSQPAVSRWEGALLGQEGDSLFDPSLWSSVDGAARTNSLSLASWKALAEDPDTQSLLGEHALHPSPLTFGSRVLALAKSGLTESESKRLATWLMGAWPTANSRRPLVTTRGIVELLNALAQPINFEEHVAEVHALLQSSWNAEDLGPAAVSASLAAAGLIHQFGAPAGFDLADMRLRLRRLATPSLVETLGPHSLKYLRIQSYRFEAGAALELLDAAARKSEMEPAAAPGSWIVSERLLLGAALLALLCVLSVLLARDDSEVFASASNE